ncbi:hypothetical protein JGH11_19185 [Dysgonomonas sp. Marseille-P4677]|uniref:hypothetical protein n=1 Tax=Dysgonomonas sp. Marseille-P4677 TaxID=2364790 RepID=UPI0019127401|nr:hypothetical protein [Dysgonomonas sp. Marseille-P4677]MBK5722997.1 hypothetical protein [Dysgonomonas sp. Marseille-P4677]
MNINEQKYFEGLFKFIETVHGSDELSKVNESNIVNYMESYNKAYESFFIKVFNMPERKREDLFSIIYLQTYKNLSIINVNKQINQIIEKYPR